MTSVALQPAALTGSLWPKHPTIRDTGLAVDFVLNAPTPAAHRTFTAVTFNAVEDHVFAFGDSAGSAYVVNMAKNRFTLVARTSQPVSALCFAGEHGATLAVASGLVTSVVQIDTAKVQHKLRGPHNNRVLKVVSPSLLRGVAASVSSDALAFWNLTTGDCLSVEHQPAAFVDLAAHGEMLYSLSADGTVKAWSFIDRVCVTSAWATCGSGVKLTSLACSAHFVVCGGGSSTLAVLRTPSLQPAWCARVHGDAPNVALTNCGTNVFAALQRDGLVSFVAIGLNKPADSAEGAASNDDDCGLTIGQSLELCAPANHVPAGVASGTARFGAVMSTSSLQIFHLPTAKAAHDKLVAAQTAINTATGSIRRLVRPFIGIAVDRDPATAAAPTDDTVEPASDHQSLQKAPIAPPAQEHINRHWVKVNLLQSSEKHPKTTGDSLFASEAVKQRYAAEVAKIAASEGTSQEDTGGNAATAVPVSRAVASAPPAAINVKSMAAPAAVQKLQRKSNPTATPLRPTARGDSPRKQFATGSQFDSISSVTADSLINLRSLEDVEARSVNLDKLRGVLMRYGVYPERFRTYIWRFLLDLGAKEDSAPLFAVLTARGHHPGTATLMRPFPLPDNRLRNALEKALSCLAHHAPVFAVAHFAPSLVFPMVSVFHSDVQSVVEVTLSFIVNWGQEFFQYYPHMPVALASLISHLLKAEDPELHEHFASIGVGAEIYVWDLISAMYTEVLTKNEWLQLFDHALSNEPLWLWMWHVRWLCQLKPSFMCLKDAESVAAMFRRATPFDMHGVVQQAYRLHGRCPRNDLTAPYERFVSPPRGEYPTVREVHESVVTSRLEELQQIEQHEAQILSLHERTRMIERQLSDAAMTEDAFVQRQRALVTAKFDGSSALWAQRVGLEQERNRLREIEHEARLKAVKAQLSASERLEQMQSDLNIASIAARQATLDREQEAMKWNFADRMANVEVERLEAAAVARLHSIMQGTLAPTITSGQQTELPDHRESRSRTHRSDASSLVPPPVLIGTAQGASQSSLRLGASTAPQPHRDGPPAPTPRASQQRTPDSALQRAGSRRDDSTQPSTGNRPVAVLERSTTTSMQEEGDSDTSRRAEPASAVVRALDDAVTPSVSAVVAAPSRHGQANDSSTKRHPVQSGNHHRAAPEAAEAATPARQQGGLPPVATPSSGGRSQHTATTTSTSMTQQTGTSATGQTDVTQTQTTDQTTSTANVTTDCDAPDHFHRLHLEIRQRVEHAQQEQRAALAALRSRYATATARATQPLRVVEGSPRRLPAHVAEDEVSDNTSVTEVIDDHHVDGTSEDDEASQFTTGSTTRSSMVETILRPHAAGTYRFR